VITLIHGSESYLVDRAARDLLLPLRTGLTLEFNYEDIQADAVNADAFAEKAGTLPFIDALRVLVLRDWGLLSGKREKGAGPERAAAYLEGIPDTTHLVLVAHVLVTPGNPIYKVVAAMERDKRARIQRYEDLVAKQNDKAMAAAQIVIPVAERLGNNVIEFSHLSKGFGDTLLIDDLSFKLPPGGIVGVIGPNGAGKTTLFRMITGDEKPGKGAIQIGESVTLGYVEQSRDALDGRKTVWEEISGGDEVIALVKREINSRAYTSAFNFKGPDQQKKVGQLSGGERNRVHLAKMLKSGANVLLLDEPTNDLDVDTLRALEEALTDFAGCAVIISHDRFFLDRIATHMLAFEGDSHVEWFEGNFAAYEEDKKRRLGIDSVIPHRLKYKQFSR